MYRRKATAMKTGSLVTPATRTGLSLFAALALMAMELAPANAQDAYGGYWGGGDVMLVTPEGDILDYIPGEAEVHAMRDRRGRTVLVDPWGNIVATVVPNDGYGRGQRRREYGRDGYPEPRDRGYGYSEPASLPAPSPNTAILRPLRSSARICPTAFPRSPIARRLPTIRNTMTRWHSRCRRP